jgi:hypothetical protein
MPLLDHFHPPLSERRHWHSFHNSWATYLSSQLNTLLPSGYFAEANVHFNVDLDVAAFEEPGGAGTPPGWVPPPVASHPFEMAGLVVEVGIFSRSGGPQLAGMIELVSPANKDRPLHRDAFEVRDVLAGGCRPGAGGRRDRAARRPPPRAPGAVGGGRPGAGAGPERVGLSARGARREALAGRVA